MKLGPGREFDRIRAVARALGERAPDLGDDCALLPFGDSVLVLSTDTSVENVHFRLDWIELSEAGWKSAASALSDLAAEGAEPLGLLTALVVPGGASDEDVTAFMSGVGGASAAAGAPVLGGDLSSGAEWSAAITVIGRSPAPVTRAGARPGDGLWVTGVLGGARAALQAWRRGDPPASHARLSFVRPEPRLVAGQWLAAHGARAMIDLSDGLGGDAAHLAAASGVAVHLDLELVPVAADAVAEARRLGVAVQQFAAEGGEDYELLVALPDTFSPRNILEFESACGVALTRVGGVERGSGVRASLGGRRLSLGGFDHFS